MGVTQTTYIGMRIHRHTPHACHIYRSALTREVSMGGGGGGGRVTGVGSWACASACSCEAGPGAGVFQKLCWDTWCLSSGGATRTHPRTHTHMHECTHMNAHAHIRILCLSLARSLALSLPLSRQNTCVYSATLRHTRVCIVPHIDNTRMYIVSHIVCT